VTASGLPRVEPRGENLKWTFKERQASRLGAVTARSR
jgi:hypothetical protein